MAYKTKTWEYKTEYVLRQGLEETLNYLGQQGWELVTAKHDADNSELAYVHLIFKRLLDEYRGPWTYFITEHCSVPLAEEEDEWGIRKKESLMNVVESLNVTGMNGMELVGVSTYFPPPDDGKEVPSKVYERFVFKRRYDYDN